MQIICLKWGDKYSAKYVNRLYNQCKKFISLDFDFYCVTDDKRDINSNIKILDINQYKVPDGKWGRNIFTGEKIKVLKDFTGISILFDLDILLLNDITEYITTVDIKKPRWIFNAWSDPNRFKKNYGRSCDINASFILTKDKLINQLHNKIFNENYDYYSFKYGSLDRVITYRCINNIEYHPDNIAYAYNFGAKYPDDLTPNKFRENYKLCLFNNSHGRGLDLHETSGWPIDLWNDYD